jgi:hypothetical protein
VSEYQPTESLQKSEISRRALLRPNAIDQGATAESNNVTGNVVVDLSSTVLAMQTYRNIFSQFSDLKMIYSPRTTGVLPLVQCCTVIGRGY